MSRSLLARLSLRVDDLEAIETRAWRSINEPSLEPTKGGGSDLCSTEVEGLVLSAAPRHEVLAVNRVIGRRPGAVVHGSTLDAVLEHYRALGVRRALLPWAPPGPEAALRSELEQREIRPYNNWVKLVRDLSPFPEVRSELEITELAPGEGEAFVDVLSASFDWPRELLANWSHGIGRPGWRHFAARRGGEVVAVGGLFLCGGLGWLGPAATTPVARSRGAQSALIAERVAAASSAGCRALVVETAEPSETRPVPSFRNLRRLGFEIAYRRPNYLLLP